MASRYYAADQTDHRRVLRPNTTMSNHTTYQLWDMGFVIAETTRAKQAETWSNNGGKVTAITQ